MMSGFIDAGITGAWMFGLCKGLRCWPDSPGRTAVARAARADPAGALTDR